MPTSTSNLQDIKRVFGEALELTAEARHDYLAAQPADVRTAVQRLLQAEADASEADEPRSVGGWITGNDALVAGEKFDRYTLVRKLGEGGHGEVWEADQQQPVRRRVAIKLLKTGLDEAQLAARFGAERQALACMDHPGVARVFDAGKDERGRLFLVMELAPGRPITKFADTEALDLRARLQLIERLCRAVQHAHQKGVIHRDLKPANVLAWRDGDDLPMKVIDFGIVKLLRVDDERFDTDTPRTEQTQLIGTPQYMSPEQASGETVLDVRSDVYALGVLLYELTTGTNPHVAAATDKGKRALLLAARDLDAPPPSTLARLPRELDWIAARALTKEPADRYATANELGDDVRRYLDGLPIEAAPPSWVYRLRRHAARNKPTFIAAAAAVALLIGGSVATSVLAVRATRAETAALQERDEANRQRELAEVAELEAENKAAEAEAVSQFFQRVLFGARPNFSPEDRRLMLRMLSNAASGLRTDLLDRPSVRAELSDMIAMIHLELNAPEEAAALANRAHEIRKDLYGEDDPRTLRSLSLVGNVQWQRRDVEASDATFLEILRLAEQRGLPGHHEVIGYALEGLIVAAQGTGRYERGIGYAERFVDALESADFADGSWPQRERLSIARQKLAGLRILVATTPDEIDAAVALSASGAALLDDEAILLMHRQNTLKAHERNLLRAKRFDDYFAASAERLTEMRAASKELSRTLILEHVKLLQQYVSAHEQGMLQRDQGALMLATATRLDARAVEDIGHADPLRVRTALMQYFMLVINGMPEDALVWADTVVEQIGDDLAPDEPALLDLKNSAAQMRAMLDAIDAEERGPVEEKSRNL